MIRQVKRVSGKKLIVQLEKRWKTMEAEKKPLMDRAEVIEVRLSVHLRSCPPLHGMNMGGELTK